MSGTVKIGLLGCGRIAQYFHLKVLSRLPNVELAALADASPELLKSAHARVPGAKTFTDYRELLASGGVDAVVNCLPTGLHAASAIAAFDAGKHVYLEKPIAITVDEGAAVRDAWRRSGKIGMVGFNFRCHPLHRRAKAMVKAGAVGNVIAARSIFCAAAHDLPNWKKQRSTGGGVLLDLFSHHADLARFLFDAEITSVTAQTRSVKSEDDTASVELKLERPGGEFGMHCFHSLTTSDIDQIEILGDGGTLVLDRYAGTLEVRPPGRPSSKGPAAVKGVLEGFKAGWRVLRPASEPSYREALGEFSHAICGGEPISVNMDDGYRCLCVVQAAEESARSGQTSLLTPHDGRGPAKHEGTVDQRRSLADRRSGVDDQDAPRRAAAAGS